jgi:5-methyltetrahydrofolate--homocysteine methyltransferase
MSRLLDALHSGRVLLMDGAMGTELLRAGISNNDCLEALNLTKPELVTAIHRAYVEAGSEVLLTNTFQANSRHLKEHQLNEKRKMEDIYSAGVRLARSVISHDGYVLACVGPAKADSDNQFFSLARNAASLDGVLLETWSDPQGAGEFLACDFAFGSTQPQLLSFAFRRSADRGLCTCSEREATPEDCAAVAEQNHVDALGVNCGLDIRLPELLEIIAAYRSVTDLPLFVRPNAGTPRQVNGQWVYPETPESMAAWLPPLFEAGVRMIGGCCGTTPAHISAFRKVVNEWNANHPV